MSKCSAIPFAVMPCEKNLCASNLINTYTRDETLRRNHISLEKVREKKEHWCTAMLLNLGLVLNAYDVRLVFEPSHSTKLKSRKSTVFAEISKNKDKKLVMDCSNDISYIDLKKSYMYFGDPVLRYVSVRPDGNLVVHEPTKQPFNNTPENMPYSIAFAKLFYNQNFGVTSTCNPVSEGHVLIESVYRSSGEVVNQYKMVKDEQKKHTPKKHR